MVWPPRRRSDRRSTHERCAPQVNQYFFRTPDLIGSRLQRNASENSPIWLKAFDCSPYWPRRARRPQLGGDCYAVLSKGRHSHSLRGVKPTRQPPQPEQPEQAGGDETSAASVGGA